MKLVLHLSYSQLIFLKRNLTAILKLLLYSVICISMGQIHFSFIFVVVSTHLTVNKFNQETKNVLSFTLFS